jgi:hypothetical protein
VLESDTPSSLPQSPGDLATLRALQSGGIVQSLVRLAMQFDALSSMADSTGSRRLGNSLLRNWAPVVCSTATFRQQPWTSQLMGTDFAQAMRCGCEQPYQNLTMDGTTISCQTANLCIINPRCTCRGEAADPRLNLCAAHPVTNAR